MNISTIIAEHLTPLFAPGAVPAGIPAQSLWDSHAATGDHGAKPFRLKPFQLLPPML